MVVLGSSGRLVGIFKKICTVEMLGPRNSMNLLTPPTLYNSSPATFRLARGNQGYGDSDESKFLRRILLHSPRRHQRRQKKADRNHPFQRATF